MIEDRAGRAVRREYDCPTCAGHLGKIIKNAWPQVWREGAAVDAVNELVIHAAGPHLALKGPVIFAPLGNALTHFDDAPIQRVSQ